MAKSPEQLLKKYADNVNLVIKNNPSSFDFLLDPSNLDSVPNIIRTRTRLGKGLLGRLKELSPKYIEARKKFKGLYKKETSPERSNLTRTGIMLNSIIGNRVGTLFTFFFKDEDSDKKAYWADQTGRPFFDLTPPERNRLQRKISAIIREEIRKLFKS
jgi:hypothetical protein